MKTTGSIWSRSDFWPFSYFCENPGHVQNSTMLPGIPFEVMDFLSENVNFPVLTKNDVFQKMTISAQGGQKLRNCK